MWPSLLIHCPTIRGFAISGLVRQKETRLQVLVRETVTSFFLTKELHSSYVTKIKEKNWPKECFPTFFNILSTPQYTLNQFFETKLLKALAEPSESLRQHGTREHQRNFTLLSFYTICIFLCTLFFFVFLFLVLPNH